ncbi:C40 family peptidase, partial [Pseudomonas aeruginosa]
MLKHILSAVQKHAAAEYPRECCGLIIRSGRSQRYVPCENTAADAGEEFRIAPEAYAEAEDQGEIVAVVHSHPDATSRPSAADVAMCNASGLTWHILSWPEGDLRTIEPVDQVPLLGRAFVHGVQDCWQVCADWYQREWGIEFPHFERA